MESRYAELSMFNEDLGVYKLLRKDFCGVPEVQLSVMKKKMHAVSNTYLISV
jgi:hypothetical protein